MWRSQVQCTSESVMRACYRVSTLLAASDVLTVVGTVALWARMCNFQQQGQSPLSGACCSTSNPVAAVYKCTEG